MTDEVPRPFKFGSWGAIGMLEHRYDDVWDIEPTKLSPRIAAAPSSGHISLMIDLMRELPDPFGLLYVLVVTRAGHEPARYQSPHPTDRDETESFLKEYQEFFECDGRHHVWVMSLPSSSTIVYDNHNIIYAYGPLERFQRVLELRGMRRGEVRFPVPHQHRYNPQYDRHEDKIMSHWPWMRFPLESDDC